MSVLVYRIFMAVLDLGQTFDMLCAFAYSESFNKFKKEREQAGRIPLGMLLQAL